MLGLIFVKDGVLINEKDEVEKKGDGEIIDKGKELVKDIELLEDV